MYSFGRTNTHFEKEVIFTARIYKTIRLAYETKYWIDQLILYRTEQLQRSIRENGLSDRIETVVLDMTDKELDGVSINITLNVTVGSIIEQVVRHSRGLTIEDWRRISTEAELAKKRIKDSNQDDSTPRIYINEQIFRELEDLQVLLREDSPRVPKMSYVIKLAVYNLFKSIN